MKRSATGIAAALLSGLMTTTAQSTEKPLPACDDRLVKTTFLEVVPTWELYEIKDYRGDDGKRWCSAYYTGKFGMRSPYMEAIFTIEWINEADGRFWLQVRQSQETCRGVMGNPWSRERCPYSEIDGKHADGAMTSMLYHVACEKLPDEIVSGIEAARKEISPAAIDAAVRNKEQELRESGVAKFCARYKAGIDKATADFNAGKAR
jgi:hypothetical protein